MATLVTLVSFNGTNGSNPTGLTIDSSGNLFATTGQGGANNTGAVCELANAPGGYSGTPTVLTSSLAGPIGHLSIDGNGNLFGTSTLGGTSSAGVVFEIANGPNGYGATTTVASFGGTNGSAPASGLVADAAGDLFGTTSGTLSNGIGTVFEIAKIPGGYASAPTTLGQIAGDGNTAKSHVMIDRAGNLLVTEYSGGASGLGAIVEFTKTNAGFAAPVTLVSFGGTHGEHPLGALVADANGNLFGTTTGGGTNADGTVFEIANTGNGYANSVTTLLNFNGTDGRNAKSPVLIDAAGNLFGTTALGGTSDNGVAFELVKTPGGYANAPTILANFSVANGTTPGGLAVDRNGNLFGISFSGGANGVGTIFELTGTGFQVNATSLTIGGTVGGQTLFDNATISPFSGVTVVDPNSAQTETITITLSATGNGVLSHLGAGNYNATTGIFTDKGTAAAVTADIHGLVFTPTAHQVAPGNAVTTSFTIAASDTAGMNATDSTTTVVATAVTTPTGPVTVAIALDDFAAGTLVAGAIVQDSAANVSAGLDGLQSIAAAGKLGSVAFTDGGTPTFSLTGTQLTQDASVVNAVTSAYNFSITADAANLTINGQHALDTVVFSGTASEYAIASSGSGTNFTVTDTGTGRSSVDHLSNIEFLQFSDHSVFVTTQAEAAVALLYQGTLGRTPDAPGLVGWQNLFATEPAATQNGDIFTSLAGTALGGLPNLTYGFTQSVEFQTKYGPLTDSQFVTQLYANVLDRTPDAAGLSGWVNALSAGHTREWVVVGFVESPEAYHNAEVGFTGQTGTVHAPWLALI